MIRFHRLVGLGASYDQWEQNGGGVVEQNNNVTDNLGETQEDVFLLDFGDTAVPYF